VTEWPNGASAITWTAIPVILLAPQADAAYARTISFVVGTGLPWQTAMFVPMVANFAPLLERWPRWFATDAVAALNRRIVQRHHKGIPHDQCAIDRFASAVHSKGVSINWLLEVKAHGRPATLSMIRCGWFRAP
jgi:hypothetical protein